MATITTTKRALGDDALTPAIAFHLEAASPMLDTIKKRLVVQSICRFNSTDGDPVQRPVTTMLTEHDGLSDAEKTTLLALLGKLHAWDRDHHKLA